jgi:hypothetical protein
MTPILGIMASQISGHLSPSSPVAGYTVWLDAADTATITQSGGAVSQWTDKSGSAYAFTQATTAYKPATGTDTQNSKNVLTWGVSDLLQSTAASSTWKFLHYSQNTIFLAFKQTVAADTGLLLTDNEATTNDIGMYLAHQTTSKLQAVSTIGTTGQFAINNSTANSAIDTNFTYITLISDPQNATVANRSDFRVKQGSAIKNNAASNSPTNSSPTTTLRIGDYAPGSGIALNGTLGEIIIYSSNLSAGNILLNQQYLAAKWGV